MNHRRYTTYILTNANRAVLYTGVTNNLRRRLIEHWVGKEGSFTTRYNVYYLVWHEETRYVLNAIRLEKEIKQFSRQRKESLIQSINPDWNFLNETVLGYWPPTQDDIAAVVAFRKQHSGRE